MRRRGRSSRSSTKSSRTTGIRFLRGSGSCAQSEISCLMRHPNHRRRDRQHPKNVPQGEHRALVGRAGRWPARRSESYRRSVPMTTISTCLPPHAEQTSRSRQSRTQVPARHIAGPSRRDPARPGGYTPCTTRSTAPSRSPHCRASSAGRVVV